MNTSSRKKVKPAIAILMGSASDYPTMKSCEAQLDSLGITYETKVLSAHRTPKETCAYVERADRRGTKVFICAAGMAAHLAGVVAAHTTLPVIGVPMVGPSLDGMDALLATVQMPGGIPVATVTIGKAGAKNAALLAAQILALSSAPLRKKLKALRAAERRKILKTKLPA